MVIEDFAARPARPGVAHRPEIVAGRDTDDTAFGQPRNLAPQIECLVVGVIDSRGQLFGRQPPRLVDQRPGLVERLGSEERGEGKASASKCRSWWSPDP